MEIIDFEEPVQVACYSITRESWEENKGSIPENFRRLVVNGLVRRCSLVSIQIIWYEQD
jgi:hypothetical protein